MNLSFLHKKIQQKLFIFHKQTCTFMLSNNVILFCVIIITSLPQNCKNPSLMVLTENIFLSLFCVTKTKWRICLDTMPSNGDVNALSLPEVLEAARIELGEDKKQMEVSYCQLTL